MQVSMQKRGYRIEVSHADYVRYRFKKFPGIMYYPSRRIHTFPAYPGLVTRALEVLKGIVEVNMDQEVRMLDQWFRSSVKHMKSVRTGKAELMEIPICKFEPWHHQQIAYNFAFSPPAAMLAMGMGTGKTKVTFDLVINRGDSRILVVCPSQAVDDVWPLEWEKHRPDGHNMIVEGLSGSSVEHRTQRAFELMTRGHEYDIPVLLSINFEAVWREPFKSWALEQEWDLIVVDESHRIKSAGSVASHYLYELGSRSLRRLALSGTPMADKPIDVYGQYRFLEPAIYGTNSGHFQDLYTVKGGFNNFTILGYKNQREMAKKYFSMALEIGEDVLDLPAEHHIEKFGVLPARARRLYYDIEQELMSDIKIRKQTHEVTVGGPLPKFTMLTQITSGYVRDDNKQSIAVHRVKEDMLEEALYGMADDEPVVIFSRFWWDLDAIQRVCKRLKRRYMELSGRRKDYLRWKQGGAEILGVQIQSGNEAVDFSRAHYVIYYSPVQSLKDYLQSLRRARRPGQTQPVTYIHLLMRATIDIRIRWAQRHKKEVIESVKASYLDPTIDLTL